MEGILSLVLYSTSENPPAIHWVCAGPLAVSITSARRNRRKAGRAFLAQLEYGDS
jgi:hypothetical protein